MSTAGQDLVHLQRQFLAHLRGTPDPRLSDAVDVGRLPADTGLGIYAHAYGARLREALENDHPVLGQFLGDESWEALCSGYIAAHPSRVRSLRDFGNALPAYLAKVEPFRHHPQLAELARFERALLDSFDAADDPRADLAQLQAIPAERWPGLRARLHRSVRVHRDVHGSVAIWQAIKAGGAPPAAPLDAPVDWVLWRDEEGVGRFGSLEADEAHAFASWANNGNFADLCERLAATLPLEAVPVRALGCLQGWCVQGWIAQWLASEEG